MIVQCHCSVRYDIPMCNDPVFVPLLDQHKHFRTCPGNRTMTEHFIPTTGAPVKVLP